MEKREAASAETVLAALTKLEDRVRVASSSDCVYKDQCIYCHDTPCSPSGLYICLHSFLGLAADRLAEYCRRTGHSVFLHMRRISRPQTPRSGPEEPEAKVTRLAIGVEGGFPAGGSSDEGSLQLAVVVMPGWMTLPVPDDGEDKEQLLHVLERLGVPGGVARAVVSVLSADSAETRRLLSERGAGTWRGDTRAVSRHAAELVQLENGVQVPPSGWRCQRCDKTDNLWLNLTCGTILCGRRFFDGSGGNNHALEYFRETGYPLAVKLGTIGADAPADVFSYAEDDMVEDPLLDRHLAHFGIRASGMHKTDKSMAELEIAINQRVGEWATIQEDGHELVSVYGPGYTGLRNLGNSCYMNAVMQVLFAVPQFVHRYFDSAETVFARLEPRAVVDDFDAQMCKLAQGLLSGRYSRAPDPCSNEGTDGDGDRRGIDPSSFRAVVSRGHAEFSSRRQQDAQEFFLHLVNLIERQSRLAREVPVGNAASLFRHRVEERLQCGSTGHVRYSHRSEYCLPLPVPIEPKIETAANSDTAAVRPEVKLEACLSALTASRTVDRFFSPAAQCHTAGVQSVRLATMPPWLLVQLQKFSVGADWLPRKLDVSVDMPEQLDLSDLRAHGLQPGELPMPEEEPTPVSVEIDEAVVGQLVEMGFPESACRRAVYSTANSGLENALNWVMEHMTDANFAAPFNLPGTVVQPGASEPPEDDLQAIMAMGFTREQASLALHHTDNNVQRAADWIFSHQHELESPQAPSGGPQEHFDDGSSRYQLHAFVSHMGASSESGHYVCHVRRDGRWCIYNDEKVSESRDPPRHLGYLYLYRRCD